jgi:tRNA threonylcarbamoyladenosine biosynthesis protein TsaE
LTARLTEAAGQTEALGARLAAGLRPGDVVLVSGELGTGKTTFVRGACRALGVREPVVSPTFTIGRRYRARMPVSHLDLYRLGDLGDEEPALLDDYLPPDASAFVEWPHPAVETGLQEGVRIASRVEIDHAGGDRREISIDPLAGPLR